MAEKKQLGVFWGDNSLFFVESLGISAKKFFSVPLMAEDATPTESPSASKGVNLASLISNSFRKQNINPGTVNLSLPTKDIIFRTFVIPWMQSHELKGVVSFEASKYIPFPLDELSYTFHPITINDAGTRRIRIILVAIKKNALDKYTSTLEQSSMSVGSIEPGFLSLIRALNLSNNLPTAETAAVFVKRFNAGEIIITNHGIPQFVREFNLAGKGSPQEANAPDDMTRVINEMRISLDYFNRQESELHVGQCLLITSSPFQELSKNLEADLGIPIKTVGIQSILGNNQIAELDYIDAFGAGVIDKIELPISFDFSKKKTSSTRFPVSSIKQVANLKPILVTFAICFFLNIFIWTVAKGSVKGPQNEITNLRQQLGPYENVAVDKLQETITANKTKLEGLNQLHFEKNIFLILNVLPQLMPDGVWLSTLDITESPPQKGPNGSVLTLDFSGLAYSENANQEFQLVTKFQQNIQANNDFNAFFKKSIDLEDVKAQKVNEYDVVSFRIKCQNK